MVMASTPFKRSVANFPMGLVVSNRASCWLFRPAPQCLSGMQGGPEGAVHAPDDDPVDLLQPGGFQ